MSDTTCSDCGKKVGPDQIHTCSPQLKKVDTMRAAFEAWDCQEFCIDVEHYKQVNGVYVDAPIRNRWLTWKAAQSQPAPPTAPDPTFDMTAIVNISKAFRPSTCGDDWSAGFVSGAHFWACKKEEL